MQVVQILGIHHVQVVRSSKDHESQKVRMADRVQEESIRSARPMEA